MVAHNRMHSRSTAPERRLPSMGDVRSAARTVVVEQPVAVTLAAFGMGIGLGVAVGMMISETEFFQQQCRRQESTVDQIMGAISSVLPDALARHLRA